MRLTAAKWFATALLSLSAFGVASTMSEAEACFGRGCGYRAYYGYYGYYRGWGCGYYGCGSSCYTPCCGYGCSPCSYGCSPCGSGCSPCGLSCASDCGTCASGNCSISSPSPSPAPSENWKEKGKNRTYAEPAPGDATTGDVDNSRINSDSGLNDGNDDAILPAGGSDSSGSAGSTRSQKTTPVFPKSKKGPPASKADDSEGANFRKAPTISIDEKIAWRSAPVRQRIEVRTHSANARLVRLPAYPKSDWLPAEPESKVASK